MRSLIGDRLLKKFVGGILRRLASAQAANPKPNDREDMLNNANNPEHRDIQEKEVMENIAQVDEMNEAVHQQVKVDQSEDANHLSDEE